MRVPRLSVKRVDNSGSTLTGFMLCCPSSLAMPEDQTQDNGHDSLANRYQKHNRNARDHAAAVGLVSQDAHPDLLWHQQDIGADHAGTQDESIPRDLRARAVFRIHASTHRPGSRAQMPFDGKGRPPPLRRDRVLIAPDEDTPFAEPTKRKKSVLPPSCQKPDRPDVPRQGERKRRGVTVRASAGVIGVPVDRRGRSQNRPFWPLRENTEVGQHGSGAICVVRCQRSIQLDEPVTRRALVVIDERYQVPGRMLDGRVRSEMFSGWRT